MTWICTNSSKQFDFKRLAAKNVCLQDIAHALSYTCRYNGQCHAFYSVAEHSLNMADYIMRKGMKDDGKITDKTIALADQALLHDAAEAYCGDMVKPLKELMPAFDAIEQRVMRLILKKYHQPLKLSKEVKDIDRRIMLNEKARLFPPDAPRWPIEDELEALEGVDIHCYNPMDIFPVYLQVLNSRFGKYD